MLSMNKFVLKKKRTSQYTISSVSVKKISILSQTLGAENGVGYIFRHYADQVIAGNRHEKDPMIGLFSYMLRAMKEVRTEIKMMS